MPRTKRSFFRKTCLVVAVFAALYALNVGRYLVWPPVGGLADTNPSTTTLMDYRKDQAEASGRTVRVRQTWKPLAGISRHLRQAVVVAEDSTFWEHEGFDWEGMRIAMDRNIAKRRLAAGGSTISQQLAKNLFFTPKKSITRKLQEAIVTWRLEHALEKDRILELYLNVVEWGPGIYGAEAAARHHFGVSAANLSRQQAAVLAAMLPAPLKRTPSSRHVRQVAGRIMARMR